MKEPVPKESIDKMQDWFKNQVETEINSMSLNKFIVEKLIEENAERKRILS